MPANSPLLKDLDISLDNLDKYTGGIFSEKPDIPSKVIAALKNGDHHAYEEVFNAYHAPIKGFLTRMMRDENEAQEITQQVFINLWEKHDKVDPKKNIKGFLYKTAKFYLLNQQKHQDVKSRYEAYQVNYPEDYMDSPDDIIVAKELSLIADLAISKMPQQQRNVFNLHYNECKTNDEIAELLNISTATVYVHLRNGKNELRGLLTLFIALFLSI